MLFAAMLCLASPGLYVSVDQSLEASDAQRQKPAMESAWVCKADFTTGSLEQVTDDTASRGWYTGLLTSSICCLMVGWVGEI